MGCLRWQLVRDLGKMCLKFFKRMSTAYNIYCDESCHLENDKQSVMVLAMVSVGGVGNIAGAVLGTFAILGLDRVAIPLFESLFGDQAFVMFSVRELSYLLFGLALYGSVFVASRQLRIKLLEHT